MPNEGLIRYRWFFNQERVLLCSPKALSEVLTTNSYAFQKPASVSHSIGRILGYGLLLIEGDEHRQQRRNLMPAFAFRHIKDLYPVFWKKSCETVQAMSAAFREETTTEMEVGQWAQRCTLDIIGLAGMGRDFNAIRDENNELVKSYQRLFRPSKQSQILGFLSMFFPSWLLNALPVRLNLDINQAAGQIRSTCRALIEEKKAKLANKEHVGVDILSVALESGAFADDKLVDHLMTFLAAGHETTASSMMWAVYMLCRYPEVQSKLREEVRQKLPSVDSAGDISSLDVDHMPYLNAVCSEVLRYYSPVYLTVRDSAVDTTILGQRVPAHTRIIIAPWATNHDPALWGPDVHEFRPDRWLPRGEGDKTAGNGHAASNFAFLTFLHGPRSCIGQGFARAEFACILASWVGRFEFALANEAELEEKNMEIKGGVTARPAKGLHCKVTRVDDY